MYYCYVFYSEFIWSIDIKVEKKQQPYFELIWSPSQQSVDDYWGYGTAD